MPRSIRTAKTKVGLDRIGASSSAAAGDGGCIAAVIVTSETCSASATRAVLSLAWARNRPRRQDSASAGGQRRAWSMAGLGSPRSRARLAYPVLQSEEMGLPSHAECMQQSWRSSTRYTVPYRPPQPLLLAPQTNGHAFLPTLPEPNTQHAVGWFTPGWGRSGRVAPRPASHPGGRRQRAAPPARALGNTKHDPQH
jgi:hypothetical protein